MAEDRVLGRTYLPLNPWRIKSVPCGAPISNSSLG